MFHEFEAFAQAIEHADLRCMLPRLVDSRWQIDRIDIGGMQLQHGREGSGNLAEGASDRNGLVLFFPLAGPHRVIGQAMDLDSVLILEPGAEFTVTSHAAHSWCSILIPDRLREPFSAETQPPPSTRPCSRLLPADPATMKRLRRTVLQLIDCVRVDPDVLVPPAAVRQMQAELMAACRPFLSPDPPRRAFTGRPRFHRGSLLHQIRRVLDAEAPTFPSVGQLASAVDVSERTLRNVFQDYFGVPPQRYLTIYRLHQVRAALQSADPNATTVTAVAAQFGFWEFGRFAASYHRIFAERPSKTLRDGEHRGVRS